MFKEINIIVFVISIFALIIGTMISTIWIEFKVLSVIWEVKDKIKEQLMIINISDNKDLERFLKKFEDLLINAYKTIMHYIAYMVLFYIFIVWVFLLIFITYIR